MIGICRGAIILVACAVALSGQSGAQTTPGTSLPQPPLAGDQPQVPVNSPPELPLAGDQWQTTDRSMVDLVEDGYELVSVIASSSQARTYYLRKPGKIARCREEAALESLPPPPPPSTTAGQLQTMFGPGGFVPKARMDVQCAELARPSGTKQ